MTNHEINADEAQFQIQVGCQIIKNAAVSAGQTLQNIIASMGKRREAVDLRDPQQAKNFTYPTGT